MTKKDLMKQLENVPDDAEIMVANNHYTYSVIKIDTSFSSDLSFPRVYLETEYDFQNR